MEYGDPMRVMGGGEIRGAIVLFLFAISKFRLRSDELHCLRSRFAHRLPLNPLSLFEFHFSDFVLGFFQERTLRVSWGFAWYGFYLQPSSFVRLYGIFVYIRIYVRAIIFFPAFWFIARAVESEGAFEVRFRAEFCI